MHNQREEGLELLPSYLHRKRNTMEWSPEKGCNKTPKVTALEIYQSSTNELLFYVIKLLTVVEFCYCSSTAQVLKKSLLVQVSV